MGVSGVRRPSMRLTLVAALSLLTTSAALTDTAQPPVGLRTKPQQPSETEQAVTAGRIHRTRGMGLLVRQGVSNEHSAGQGSSEESVGGSGSSIAPPVLAPEGPLPTQPPEWKIALARQALAAPLGPTPTDSPLPPWRSNAAFPTQLPPGYPIGYQVIRTPPSSSGPDCIENPRGCPCSETIRQCREETYMCEASMQELQKVMPKTWANNFLSKFDHPLLNTLEVAKRGETKGKSFLSGLASSIYCTASEKVAAEDCLFYYHACDRNQDRISKRFRTMQQEIQYIDTHPLV